MLSPIYQFMVDAALPDQPGPEFMDLLPYQQAVVDRHLSDGNLVNYAVSMENARMWAIFNANSEMEVLEMLADFPLTRFLDLQVNLLTSFNTKETEPSFSLN